jgi:hypothetical protein
MNRTALQCICTRHLLATSRAFLLLYVLLADDADGGDGGDDGDGDSYGDDVK